MKKKKTIRTSPKRRKKKFGSLREILGYIKPLEEASDAIDVHAFYGTDPSLGTRLPCARCVPMC